MALRLESSEPPLLLLVVDCGLDALAVAVLNIVLFVVLLSVRFVSVVFPPTGFIPVLLMLLAACVTASMFVPVISIIHLFCSSVS